MEFLRSISPITFEGKCDICLDNISSDSDRLVHCVQCKLSVHQSCYGGSLTSQIDSINYDEWICYECKWNANHSKIDSSKPCILCNIPGGALKKLSSEDWAHITCVNWNQWIYFTDLKKEATNVSIQILSLKRTRNEICYICGSSSGMPMKCDYKSCRLHHHVRCAMKQGIIGDWKFMNQFRKVENLCECTVYCQDHLEIYEENTQKFSKRELKDRFKRRAERKQERKLKLKK